VRKVAGAGGRRRRARSCSLPLRPTRPALPLDLSHRRRIHDQVSECAGMRPRIFRPRPWSAQVRVTACPRKISARRCHALECAGMIRNEPGCAQFARDAAVARFRSRPTVLSRPKISSGRTLSGRPGKTISPSRSANHAPTTRTAESRSDRTEPWDASRRSRRPRRDSRTRARRSRRSIPWSRRMGRR
jgi:hypothetical protein